MKKILLIITIILSISGCGGSDDAGSNNQKSLFSLWKENGGGNEVLDFRGGAFNQNLPFGILLDTGNQCACDIVFIGDESSGVLGLNSCTFVPTMETDYIAGCEGFNSAGRYTNSGTELILYSSDDESYSYF